MFENFIKIAGIVKAYAESQTGHGMRIRIVTLDLIGGFKNAELHEVLDGSDLKCSFETAAAFTFADVDRICKIFQSDMLGIIFFRYKEWHLLPGPRLRRAQSVWCFVCSEE